MYLSVDLLSAIISFFGLLITLYLAFYFHKIRVDKLNEKINVIISRLDYGKDIIPIDMLRLISDIIDERNVSVQTEIYWNRIINDDFDDKIEYMMAYYYDIIQPSYNTIAHYKVPWDENLTIKNFFRDFNKEDTENFIKEFVEMYNNGKFKTKDDLRVFLKSKAEILNHKFNKFLDEMDYQVLS